MTPNRVGRARVRLWLLLTLLVTLFCTAPVPGDIGGCGQSAQDLDASTFFASKKAVDCQRCNECGLGSQACRNACDTSQPAQTAFPQYCYPLVHDGEVCLRALMAASCNAYTGFMDDSAPGVPTECDFCPSGKGP